MAFGLYEVGVIQGTPVPNLLGEPGTRLGNLARSSFDLKRSLDTSNETSHVFQLPAVLRSQRDTLYESIAVRRKRMEDAQREQSDIQVQIDDLSFSLYGIGEEDRRAMEAEAGTAGSDDLDDSEPEDE